MVLSHQVLLGFVPWSHHLEITGHILVNLLALLQLSNTLTPEGFYRSSLSPHLTAEHRLHAEILVLAVGLSVLRAAQCGGEHACRADTFCSRGSVGTLLTEFPTCKGAALQSEDYSQGAGEICVSPALFLLKAILSH